MFQQVTIQSVIENQVHSRSIATGWTVCKCPLCNDYKERAGFKFEDGQVIYNCWNCSSVGKYEEFSGQMSKSFRKILNAFGIDDSEISSIVNTAFFNKKDTGGDIITLAKLQKINTNTPEIKLPEKSFPIGHPEFIDYQQKLVNYLIKRNINIDKYNFFFSLNDRMIDRIIIPFYRHGKLIYWQARSINDNEKKRYDNSPIGREAVIFNIDQLNSYSTTPLFVTEGVFDAMIVDGVAIIGSKLNEAKIELLSKSRRRIIFVIDKDITGRHLAEEVLNKKWEIAFAPSGAEDLNKSVQRFGLSWTIYELMKSIPKDNDAARLSINLNCR